jgi:NADPH2:quinone reductase
MVNVQVVRFGGPEVLEVREEPDPVAGRGEALVAVEVADVLTLDAALRAGDGQGWFDLRPPYVPGGGIAGRVLEVGDPRDADWVGRRVVARLGQSGAGAERAVAPVEALVAVPDALSSADAAALVHDGLTAAGLLEAARVEPGERVLVTAAAGAMGVLLVQRLLAMGAVVVGAVRGTAKRAVVGDLGAAVADYDDPEWGAAAVALAGGPFAVVLDGVGGEVGRAAFAVTSDGGRFSAHGAPSGDFAPVAPEAAAARAITLRGIRDLWFAPDAARRLTGAVLADAAAGRLRPAIVRPLPLHRAADAHRVIDERRTAGKTLLVVDRPADLRPAVAVAAEVLTWAGTDATWGARGEHALTVHGEELGHLHGDRVAHFAFPRDVGTALREAGRVEPHPVDRHSPRLAARRIGGARDVEDVIALLRLNHDRITSDRAVGDRPAA